MSNPSTVWAQLASPNQAAGSLPFVSSDNATILTDVVNFFYSQGLAQLSGSIAPYQLTVAGGLRTMFTDSTATPGSVTINKPAGRVKIAAGQTTIVVTNSYCFSNSLVQLQMETNDATMTRVIPVPATGSFSITGNAACTGAVTINFEIQNVY